MGRNRFKFLHAKLCFDDPDTRKERWPTDRFAAAREIWELFNANLSKYVYPSEYLSIDETLYPMRHQIAHRMYNPAKPARYGLLKNSINDARFPYTYKSYPYAGKPKAGDGPYYLASNLAKVQYLVQETMKDLDLRGRCIATDRLYTSPPQAEWLMDRDIRNIGTINNKRQGVPAILTDNAMLKERPIHSVTCHYQVLEGEGGNDHITRTSLMSYAVQTGSGQKKSVLMLSTARPLKGATVDDKADKPAIYKLYDFTKGGTDIVDQCIDF